MAFALNLVLSGSVALIFSPRLSGNLSGSLRPLLPFRLEQLPHLVGGMAWMSLWVFLWTLDPGCRSGLRTCQALHLPFDPPYILMTRPDVKATEAIQVSARETKGYRGKMFLADLLIYGSWAWFFSCFLGWHKFVSCMSRLRFIGSRSGTGRRPDAPGGRSCPGWLL